MIDAFSPQEERGLTALLDTLIPASRERGMPGAGAIGLSGYIAEHAADLQPLIVQGLAALDESAREHGAESFAALSPPERAELLNAHAENDPGLVPALVFHGYSGYYQHPRVVAALGFEHRPPYPEGYPMEATDETRLDAMRRRPALYRDV